jgi:hypothetical protein
VSRTDGPAGASADGTSIQPAIDAAGDVVAFASGSPNLGTASSPQVFVRDLARSQTELVSRPVDGEPVLPTAAEAPSIDATGNRISFVAFGAIEAPATPFFEAFVRDRGAAATTLVSRAHGAAERPPTPPWSRPRSPRRATASRSPVASRTSTTALPARTSQAF